MFIYVENNNKNILIYRSFTIIRINEINNEYIYILNFVKALYYFS